MRSLLTQNSAKNACKKLSIVRGQWENNRLLRALFPELLPHKNSTWTADALCLNRTQTHPESTFEAAGTNTKVVSRHYNVIVEDDTVAPDLDELGNECLAPTKQDVEQAIGWHRLILPLFVNPVEDESLVVGTRWYDYDLIQFVKDNQPEYHVITRAVKEDSTGEPNPAGDLIYPERFPEEVLGELERSLGPYMFSCLYYNKPVRSDDMTFKPEWIQYYETRPRSASLAIYTTIDPATDPELATTKDTDYSVVMTCGKDMITGDIYVLDYFREKCNPGELIDALFEHVMMYHPLVVGYEDVAYQRSIDYWVKERMRKQNMYFMLEPIKGINKKSKDARIAALQPLFAAGVIHIRPWMKALESELLKWPLDRHDDLPDCLSMQLQLWRTTKAKQEIAQEQSVLDPLSVDYALEELKKRAEKDFDSLVFDPSRSLSMVG